MMKLTDGAFDMRTSLNAFNAMAGAYVNCKYSATETAAAALHEAGDLFKANVNEVKTALNVPFEEAFRVVMAHAENEAVYAKSRLVEINTVKTYFITYVGAACR